MKYLNSFNESLSPKGNLHQFDKWVPIVFPKLKELEKIISTSKSTKNNYVGKIMNHFKSYSSNFTIPKFIDRCKYLFLTDKLYDKLYNEERKSIVVLYDFYIANKDADIDTYNDMVDILNDICDNNGLKFYLMSVMYSNNDELLFSFGIFNESAGDIQYPLGYPMVDIKHALTGKDAEKVIDIIKNRKPIFNKYSIEVDYVYLEKTFISLLLKIK